MSTTMLYSQQQMLNQSGSLIVAELAVDGHEQTVVGSADAENLGCLCDVAHRLFTLRPEIFARCTGDFAPGGDLLGRHLVTAMDPIVRDVLVSNRGPLT